MSHPHLGNCKTLYMKLYMMVGNTFQNSGTCENLLRTLGNLMGTNWDQHKTKNSQHLVNIK
jgi:hypothetical protein